MSATKKSIDINVVAKDLASAVLKGVENKVGGLGLSMIKLDSALNLAARAFNMFSGVLNTIKSTFTGLIDTFISYAQRGGDVQDVTIGFTKQFENSEKALEDLRKASNGTITDFDLMLSANKAAMLGVTTDSEELARLLEVAAARGQALGVSTTQAFQDIVTGIGRNSPLILDNLGITTGAYKEQIAVLEEKGIVLSEEEKKQILLAEVLKDTSKSVTTATTRFEQMSTIMENFRNRAGEKVANLFTRFIDYMLPRLQTALDNVRVIFARVGEVVKDNVAPFFEEMRKLGDRLAESITGLTDPTSEASNIFVELADNLSQNLLDALVWVSEQVIVFIEYLRDNPEVIANVVQKIKDFADKAFELAKFIITDVVPAVGSFIGFLKDLFTKAKDVRDKMQEIWDKLGPLKTAIELLFNPLGFLVNHFDDVTGAVGGAIDKVKSFLGLGKEALGITSQLTQGQGALGNLNIVLARGDAGSVNQANGGNFTVPNGYPNDSFRLNVESGEQVQVTPARQARANSNQSQPTQMIFNIGSVDSTSRIRQLVSELNKAQAGLNNNSLNGLNTRY